MCRLLLLEDDRGLIDGLKYSLEKKENIIKQLTKTGLIWMWQGLCGKRGMH